MFFKRDGYHLQKSFGCLGSISQLILRSVSIVVNQIWTAGLPRVWGYETTKERGLENLRVPLFFPITEFRRLITCNNNLKLSALFMLVVILVCSFRKGNLGLVFGYLISPPQGGKLERPGAVTVGLFYLN